MPDLTTTQWLGVAVLAVGAVWQFGGSAVSWVKRRILSPVVPEPAESDERRLARFGRLSAVQADLEACGHTDEAAKLDALYALLRHEQQERRP